jgi:hypothetical protein
LGCHGERRFQHRFYNLCRHTYAITNLLQSVKHCFADMADYGYCAAKEMHYTNSQKCDDNSVN